MYRFFFLLLWLAFTVSSSIAAPRLVTKNLTYDFGEITQGDKIIANFSLQNGGNNNLEIRKIRSSCSCTATLLTSRQLSPKATGNLQVIFHSQGLLGTVKKQVTIETNDPKHRALSFSIQGKINPILQALPQKLIFKMSKAKTTLNKSIRIINNSNKTISLKTPNTSSSEISALLSSKVIPPQGEVIMTVSAIFTTAKKKSPGYILIYSDRAEEPDLKISVSIQQEI